METESLPLLTTARSGNPSPLKSPLATATGPEPTGFRESVLNNGLLCAATRVDNATTAKRTCDKRAGRRRDMSDSWWSIFLRGRQLLRGPAISVLGGGGT